MNPSSPWPFPMQCPSCKAATGKPYRAETTEEHGSIRVIVKCELCGHEWPADLASRKTNDGQESQPFRCGAILERASES